MIDLPNSVKKLVSALRALPSVGSRTAERLALHLVHDSTGKASVLSEALAAAKENVGFCQRCGFFTESNACAICDDPQRNSSIFCIVENPMDVLAFEKTGAFQGMYHVLHGTLSPLDGIGPDELQLPALFSRIETLKPQEIILGLNPDVRGETTCLYIARELQSRSITLTRLATGISAQTSLEFADSLTLSHALNNRKTLQFT